MPGRVVILMLIAGLVACGDDQAISPDARPPDAAPVDVPPSYPACAEFAVGGVQVPAHVLGALTGADLVSPATCAAIDAPFGVETAGPDAVVRVDGLVPGTTYVVNLASASDLGFYVATGCDTPLGPSGDRCQLFVDATGAGELGTFVATGPSAFVVVDYWSASPPADPTFTLDVYARGCDDAIPCHGATPRCLDYRCVECASSFDCTTGASSRCDAATNTCQPGIDSCVGDDAREPDDDGPAGAPLLATTKDGAICSKPEAEADYYRFVVDTVGETRELQLAWGTARDLDLEIFDATGLSLGFSYWENPERVKLTYLPPGTYYARVREFASSPNASAQPYTLSEIRTSGVGCQTATDCAAEFRNQLYRGVCDAGSCVSIEGAGAVPEGGACDSQADCGAGLSCPSFYFVADAATRETCARACSADAQCDAGFVCTTYLPDNFCVPRCTRTDQCPTSIYAPPTSGPWAHLACEVSTGRCLP
ncbi:MAG: PPC domain-containing protein [Proteobacteria bacterium]|nr:PPC domain-containing protein [Pseudomonadota bacterium]